jgi:hypothetical protein
MRSLRPVEILSIDRANRVVVPNKSQNCNRMWRFCLRWRRGSWCSDVSRVPYHVCPQEDWSLRAPLARRDHTCRKRARRKAGATRLRAVRRVARVARLIRTPHTRPANNQSGQFSSDYRRSEHWLPRQLRDMTLECLQERDQCVLVGVAESGAEIVAAVDDVIRAFAEHKQLFADIGKDLPRLLVGGAPRQ